MEFYELLVRRKSRTLRTFHKSAARRARSELSSYVFANLKWNHTLWKEFGLEGRERIKIQAWIWYKTTVWCWDDDGQSVFHSVGVFCPALPSPARRRGHNVHRDQTAAEGAWWQGVTAIWVHTGVQWNDLHQKNAAAGQAHYKIPSFHRRWGAAIFSLTF